MRYFLRVALLFAALSSLSIGVTAGGVGRFSISKRTATTTHNFTSGELYVRSLIAKKPTRRSTAQRRQTSSIPNAASATVGTTDDSGTYTTVGNLVYDSTTSDWTVSSDTASTLIVPSTPSTTSDNAIQYVDGSYMTLASCDYLSQSTYEAFYMGGGSTSYLCVTNVDLGTNAPASTPSVRLDDNGNGQVYETAVWDVGSTGSPQWTNSAVFDFSTTTLQLVYVTSAYLWPNGKLLAVADIDSFRGYIESEQVDNGFPLDEYPVTIQELVMNVS